MLAVASIAALLAGAFLVAPAPALYPGSGFSTAWLARDGELLRLSLAPDGRYRLYTPLEQVAPALVDATLAYEDRWFRWHLGVNPVALVRAAADTATGGRRRGASTLTMQLVRLRDGRDTTTPSGKLKQIAAALWLELHHSKHDILEAYLNLAPYGGNIEGAGAASRIYFGKPAAQLTRAEAATLAVIPQNPGRRNPAGAGTWAELDAARGRLLAAWQEVDPDGAPSPQDFALRLAVRGSAQLPFRAPHYVDALQARSAATGSYDGPIRGGERRSSLDLALQALLEREVESHLAPRRSRGVVNASAMVIDWRTREVLALVGSADYFDAALQGQVNGALAARSPGSTLKPFVYALAMQQGLIHPMTLLKDAPQRFGAYSPENSDQQFAGPVLAGDALNLSRNVPAVQLQARLTGDGLWGLLQRAGVRNLRSAEHYGLALALGGNELTMAELVSLYAMLADRGRWLPLQWHPTARGTHAGPMLREAVGRTAAFAPGLIRTGLAPVAGTRTGAGDDAGVQLLDAEAAFMTLEILRRHPAPDLGGAAPPYPVYWKTGTSWAFRDAWTVGIAGPYVVAAWAGNFDGRGNPAFTGREAAAPLFFRTVRALARARPQGFDPNGIPPGLLDVRQVEVCASTGDLPGAHCPQRTKTWFVPGVSPIRVNTIYREVPVDVATGARACTHEPPRTRLQVFEFWPSDLASLYRQAGIARALPPPAPDCEAADPAGAAPEIRSPDVRVTQVLTAQRHELPLAASADADAGTLHWFADDGYIGAAAANATLAWQPRPGRHLLRVVDERGRADAAWVAVEAAPY